MSADSQNTVLVEFWEVLGIPDQRSLWEGPGGLADRSFAENSSPRYHILEPKPEHLMDALNNVFALSNSIRYVALYKDGAVETAQRDGITNASASESDKYEELFINPTLLTLAKQRGNVDCGGAKFVVVGYGNFNQLVIDLPDGHLSVCFQHGDNPITYVDALTALF